jgi:hypothetical protein
VAWYTAPSGVVCTAAYDAIGATSLLDSYTDESGAGHPCAPGVAPTWTAGVGWTFNGTTQYLTTGVVPASGYSMLVRFSGASGLYRPIAGCGYGVAGERFFVGREDAASGMSYGYSGFALRLPSAASGVIGLAGNQPYRDGVTDGASIAGLLSTARAIYIGAGNGSVASLFLGNIAALAIYSGTLLAADVLAITNAMNALPTAASSAMLHMMLEHARLGFL